MCNQCTHFGMSTVNMPDVTAGYGRFFDSVEFYSNFHILLGMDFETIYFHQTYKLFVEAEVRRDEK